MTLPNTFRLASYNVRKCVGLDRRRNPGRILDVINEIGADLVALQEADRRLGPRPGAIPRAMIQAETDFVLVEIAGNDVSLGWHGNAILLRKGLLASAVTGIELPGTEPRGAVSLRVGDAIDVVAVHLGLMRSDRRRQLAKLRHGHRGDVPAAILGDFNEWRPVRGLEALADAFTVHAPGLSYHAARPVAALDRVALSDGLTLVDAGVLQSRAARVASDHLPVWADVRIG